MNTIYIYLSTQVTEEPIELFKNCNCLKVRTSKQKSEELAARKEEISGEQSRLNLKLGELNARNRQTNKQTNKLLDKQGIKLTNIFYLLFPSFDPRFISYNRFSDYFFICS